MSDFPFGIIMFPPWLLISRRRLKCTDTACKSLVAKDLAFTLEKFGYSVVGNLASGEEAVSSSDKERHERSLLNMAALISVSNSKEIADAWEKK